MNRKNVAVVILLFIFLLQFTFIFLVAGENNSSDSNKKLNIYFGGLHSHTGYSDGEKTPTDAFKHAREVGGIDFWATTDHAERFDKMLFPGADKKFKLTEEEAKKETIPDKFIAMRGFEWGVGGGHINVFNTETFIKFREANSYKAFYNWLRKHPEAIAQFNHPGETGTDIWGDFEYHEDVDKMMNCIEVVNGKAESYEQYVPYYFMALDAGWHLGPTATEDNHGDDWGIRELRTAVFAEELTEENIISALRNRNFYATADKNLQLYFYGNSNLMGSEITLPSPFLELTRESFNERLTPELREDTMRGNTINFRIKVFEPDGGIIKRIAIYTNGRKVVKEWENDKSSFETNYSLPLSPFVKGEYKGDFEESEIQPTSYYVVEVTLANGKKAISSPIWVKKAKSE